MVTEKITCDICGAERGATNHWIMYDTGTGLTSFESWNDEYRSHEGQLCGVACAVKLLTKQAEGWTSERATNAHGT